MMAIEYARDFLGRGNDFFFHARRRRIKQSRDRTHAELPADLDDNDPYDKRGHGIRIMQPIPVGDNSAQPHA